ncbi:DUF397 domain-containing protein [Streptomyces sp. V4I23]|uniref:DUF397 domain-containing protein n=1 Tax=Streptomyces sp. V4I23 TaxID=3042282 RepID=UPI0027D8FB4B|nr:hypothetical protein [Streptomyces sp. V4I23]
MVYVLTLLGLIVALAVGLLTGQEVGTDARPAGVSAGCVDFAAIPGAADSFIVRDSKPEGAGKELRYTGSELDDFALGWVKRRGLTA